VRGPVASEPLRVLNTGDVDDDRVEGGTPLGLVDATDGSGVERVRAEAVHRFRREGHEPACPEHCRGGGDGLGVG